MKKIAILLFLLAIVPLQAKALSPYYNNNDVPYNNDLLSYVAMPLAVSAVCDVRGVQTDRVGELVTYMDEAGDYRAAVAVCPECDEAFEF